MANWSPLHTAMADSRSAGVSVPVWWRDDDATQPGPALTRLLELAGRSGCSVHLAIIPGRVKTELVQHLSEHPAVPVVHGWRHDNHSPSGVKSAEFGDPRADAKDELQTGFEQMTTLFGRDLLPLFVPPWNRVHPSFLPDLRDTGYAAVSTYGARPKRRAIDGLTQINTHIDPIDWRGTRDLVDEDALIAKTAGHIRARLEGHDDPQEPLGLLTHHIVHTQAIWSFAERWLNEMLNAGAVPEPLTLESKNEQT